MNHNRETFHRQILWSNVRFGVKVATNQNHRIDIGHRGLTEMTRGKKAAERREALLIHCILGDVNDEFTFGEFPSSLQPIE